MKIFKIIPILIFAIIVTFQNFDKETSIWDLIYYSQNYIMVYGFIYLGFMVENGVLARSFLTALGLYFLFELSMDILNIYNPLKHEDIYTTRTINYVIAASMSFSLFIWVVVINIKKWILKLIILCDF